MLDLDFGSMRGRFGRFKQAQVDGFNTLLAEARRREIDPRQFAYVLATAWHETGGTMEPVSENLNYSATGLRRTFSRYFTPAQANAYARKPKEIANRAYANRIGNGDEDSGDGWRFRGRGFVQITGRANYRQFSPLVGIDLEENPEAAQQPFTATLIIFEGMGRGMFTGKGLPDYINDRGVDYRNARRIVNGTDKAQKIATYAGWFEIALTQATA